MDANLIDSIVYKQWISVDRCTLETISKSADDFVDSFCEKLETLLPHSFFAKQQAHFYSQLKEDLQPGEFLVTADFSENYSFVLQDAAQGFHWNNSQATIHPFVVYYLDMGKLHHLSYVVISDCLHHDTVAVYLFQKNLLDYLKNKFSFVRYSTFRMELLHSTRIGRISSTCATMRQTLEFLLNGISQLLLMAKVHVMVWVVL